MKTKLYLGLIFCCLVFCSKASAQQNNNIPLDFDKFPLSPQFKNLSKPHSYFNSNNFGNMELNQLLPSETKDYSIVEDGVIIGSKKYSLHIKQPNITNLIEMPKVQIDESKDYFLRVVPVQ